MTTTRAFRPALIVSLCALTLLFAAGAHSGPVLDDILNCMFVDQGTPMPDCSTRFSFNRLITLTRDQPIGQVFVAGPETERIARIRVHLGPNINWQPGEGAEMVIWDSPQKKTALGRYTIWYEFRGYDMCVAEFEVDAPVRPGGTYYLEISYVGNGDGILGAIGVMNGQFNYDIIQRIIYVNQAAPPGGDGMSWGTAFRTIQEALDSTSSPLAGQGYLAGNVADFDLCFQTHGKRRMDRVGNLKKTFARFDLDRPELAAIKKAVKKGDFETAIAKTVTHFETRTNLPAIVNPATVPRINPDYDRTAAEYAMQNIFWGDTSYAYIGPDINWRPETEFDSNGCIKPSGFTLNRFGPRGVLTQAYMATGDEKYITKLNDMLVDWYKDNPPPEESKIGGCPGDDVWSSLNTGLRLGHGFTAYNRAHSSSKFTTDCRFAYILDMANHADTLVWNGAHAGGNWAMTQNSSMIQFALDYPEFTNSRRWLDTASERLDLTIKRDILPDGVETESAPGYQRWMYYNPLLGVYQLLSDRNVSTPFSAELRNILEKMAEFFMYLAMPNGATPELGDWGDGAPSLLVRDSEVFDRPDMLYVGTRGTQGTPPAETSKCYPSAGIITMRSDWGDKSEPYSDARYMMFHGVHYGAHGHADLNSVTLYAYGHEILTDPGSHVYGSGEHDLLTQSVSHNLMTIDSQNQSQQGDTPLRQWDTTDIADYISSWVPIYGSGYHREIFYVKANNDGVQDYWVVRDKAEGAGTQSLEQRWHFKPCTLSVGGGLTATAAFAEGGNLRIMQIDPSRLQAQKTTIDSWIPRGIAEEPTKLPTVIYKTSAALPAALDTILFPYKNAQPPQHQLTVLEKSSDGLSSVFKLVQGNVEDLFIFQRSPGSKTVASESISFDGERLFVRKINGTVRSAVVVNGKQLTVNGNQLLNLADRQPWYAGSW